MKIKGKPVAVKGIRRAEWRIKIDCEGKRKTQQDVA